MARIIKDIRSEPKYKYTIYVIIFDNKIYVGKTKQINLSKCYSEHLHGRVRKTNEIFQTAIMCNKLPPIYILNSGIYADCEAFSICVAWTRYLVAHGYEPIAKDAMSSYASDILGDSATVYLQIQDTPLSSVLIPEGGILSGYSPRIKTKKSNTQVSFSLTENEYKRIKSHAAEVGVSLAAYSKSMTLRNRIVQIDTAPFMNYVSELSKIKTTLVRLLYVLCQNSEYDPYDITQIQQCITHLDTIQEDVCKSLTKVIQACSRHQGDESDDL